MFQLRTSANCPILVYKLLLMFDSFRRYRHVCLRYGQVHPAAGYCPVCNTKTWASVLYCLYFGRTRQAEHVRRTGIKIPASYHAILVNKVLPLLCSRLTSNFDFFSPLNNFRFAFFALSSEGTALRQEHLHFRHRIYKTTHKPAGLIRLITVTRDEGPRPSVGFADR